MYGLDMKLTLEVLFNEYTICQLPPDAPIPYDAWAQGGDLTAFINTPDELTLVCQSDRIPADVRNEPGWRAIKVAGPLEFSMVGVLASLASTLAKAGVSIFVLSTFDTDYLLVKAAHVAEAIQAFQAAGHQIEHR